MQDTVHRVRPDVIVNAAAYTAVDRAETDASLARVVNANAPGVLARSAENIGAWLVHYSTDYVFDGSGCKPWNEDDETGPLNVYGRSKLEGEQQITRFCSRHLILRTSWVYAGRGKNFAKTMLRLASEQERLTVINDQFGAPTGAELLADVTAHVVRSVATAADGNLNAGIYHLAASGETSWHGYARFVLDHALRTGAALRASAETIDAVPTLAFPTAAARPLNSRLDTSRLQATFGLTLPSWQSGVARMLAEIQ